MDKNFHYFLLAIELPTWNQNLAPVAWKLGNSKKTF